MGELVASAPVYSLVVPVYRNEHSLTRLLDVVGDLFDRLDAQAELVVVVDGSPDGSAELLSAQLPQWRHPSQLVLHARNFGSFSAIRTGFQHARGDHLAVMAADLQEPIELIEEFFAMLRRDEADVVVGRREGRADGSSSMWSNVFWSLYRRLVVPEIPEGGVDVFGLNKMAAGELLRLGETGTSLVAQLFWIGMRRAEVGYLRLERQEGKSAWTWRKKWAYLGDSIFAFTSLPIRMLWLLGLFGMVITLGISVIVFVAWLTGGIPQPGYTPLMLVLLGCTFLLTAGLGIVGGYVHRAYENTKGRPAAIVTSTTSFGPASNR
ncbi:MAG: glycosyltransferase family 2 protein [Propionibacteriaceae bacterium]|nr:glycosyltransferase family 2 protein [Propionibacteriaceae bacterium]